MAADDFNDTNSDTSGSGTGLRSRLLLGSWVLFGVLLAGLIGWVIMINDPLGGEPVAIVKFTTEKNQETAANTQDLGMRKAMRPEDPARLVKGAKRDRKSVL